MRLIYWHILFLIQLSNTNTGWTQQVADGCGVSSEIININKFKPWLGNNEFLADYLSQINYSAYRQNYFYQIPIQFWIYANNNGITPTTPFFIKSLVIKLNQYNQLNNTGLVFYALPQVMYIKNDKHLNIKWHGEALQVTQKYKNKQAINVHIVQDISKRKYLFFGEETTHYRGLYNDFTEGIIIRTSSSSSTLAHEVGHLFGLDHTHKNADKTKDKQECVSRQRTTFYNGKTVRYCEINGDGLCDTPADPNIGTFVSETCEYTGFDLRDKWGDTYTPDPSNIMAYPYIRRCRCTFSQQQVAVMLYTAAQHSMASEWAINNRTILADKYEPDNIPEFATPLLADKKQKHSLHLISDTNKTADTDYFVLSVNENTLLRLVVESTDTVKLYDNKNQEMHLNSLLFLNKGRHYFSVRCESPDGAQYSITTY